MTLHRTLLLGGVFATLLYAPNAQAMQPGYTPEPSRVRIGARIGANVNILSSPTDPVGEPTLLYGSSIAGLGFLIGPTAHYRVTDLTYRGGPADVITTWGVTMSALYSRHSGVGLARNEDNNEEQALTLVSHVLHVPVLFELEHRMGELGARVGLGPELLWTLASSADVEYTNINTPAPELETTNTFHIGLAAMAGVVFDLGEYKLPVMLHMTWDPQVPGNTRERFEGYVDEQTPGSLEVAFDWQYALVFGVDF